MRWFHHVLYSTNARIVYHSNEVATSQQTNAVSFTATRQ